MISGFKNGGRGSTAGGCSRPTVRNSPTDASALSHSIYSNAPFIIALSITLIIDLLLLIILLIVTRIISPASER